MGGGGGGGVGNGGKILSDISHPTWKESLSLSSFAAFHTERNN